MDSNRTVADNEPNLYEGVLGLIIVFLLMGIGVLIGYGIWGL